MNTKFPSADDMYEAYHKYSLSCEGANRELFEQALEYEEEYFDDMTFQPDSILSAYLSYEEENISTGERSLICDNYYMGLDENCIRFFVEDLPKNIAGQFDPKERKVIVALGYTENKMVILHEMIHMYEHIINECEMPFYREILFLCLYNKVKAIIPDLDDRILDHSHVIRGREIAYKGGSHGILFYLKSLELDLRLGNKPGTVCGYGRDEYM